MEILNYIILAIVQGITEWLPISSSGHLVLFQNILKFNPGITFDVALHFGTLMAVFVYFGKDIVDIIESVIKLQFKSENGRLGILLIISSLPAAFIGLTFNKMIEDSFNSLLITGIGFGITSLLLFITSLKINDKPKNISKSDAFIIGIAQAVAIVPGISRSGSTISMGILRGLDSKKAMKFSFLMSIPVIFGAGILEIGSGKLEVNLIWATLVAFFIGLLTIHLLLKFISKSNRNMKWFAYYALFMMLLTLILFFFF